MDSLHFMEPEGSSPCAQEPTSSPYPEPGWSSPHRPSCFLNTYFSIILPCTRGHGMVLILQILRVEFESRQGRVFSLLETVQTGSGALQLPIQRCLELIPPEIKELEREADYSPPPSAEVRNAWSYPSIQYCVMASTSASLSLLQPSGLPSLSLFCGFPTKTRNAFIFCPCMPHAPPISHSDARPSVASSLLDPNIFFPSALPCVPVHFYWGPLQSRSN